jgi:hypothetical protein
MSDVTTAVERFDPNNFLLTPMANPLLLDLFIIALAPAQGCARGACA